MDHPPSHHLHLAGVAATFSGLGPSVLGPDHRLNTSLSALANKAAASGGTLTIFNDSGVGAALQDAGRQAENSRGNSVGMEGR